ncbi:MAG: primosomal protein N', partial [Clostridia bacterium]|nr:primosomal protein N' [Clostridia bacterium]
QSAPKDDNVLNEEQQNACDELCALYRTHEPKAALLHGVTGSGKTRVIKAMMDEVLADGRQVIMLVPEISLTPQSVSIFCSYYGNRVALLHSALSAGERLDVWRRVKRGEVDIVIGTRSAVFVPFERLGMIVIDEEQEHTYKSDSNPKYHARDAARYRCAKSSALLLLASATPSLESYYKAERGIYSLITLKNRYGGAALPEVVMADMHGEILNGSGDTPLGSILAGALAETKEKNEQSILFINRRGYHKYVSCLSCKTPVMCPHCSVPMTLHKKSGALDAADTVIDPTQPQSSIGGVLVCHYCGTRVRTPQVCPDCHGPHLHAFGYGTQRAEEDLEKRFHEIRARRMDMDTTKEKFSHDLILKSFRNHSFDVLLGTQMVTKGHDFPDVTLVGILSADAMLYQDDYRASEKAFSLITQVIGRAGRGDKPGRAVIQTYNPDNEILKLAAAQDYETFYRGAIRMREAMVFPPFCEMVLLSYSSSEEVEVMNAAAKIASRLRELIAPGGAYADVQMAIFGPFEAQVYKVNEKFRMRMILKCRLNRRTRALLDQIMTESYNICSGRVAVSIDINPSNL